MCNRNFRPTASSRSKCYLYFRNVRFDLLFTVPLSCCPFSNRCSFLLFEIALHRITDSIPSHTGSITLLSNSHSKRERQQSTDSINPPSLSHAAVHQYQRVHPEVQRESAVPAMLMLVRHSHRQNPPSQHADLCCAFCAWPPVVEWTPYGTEVLFGRDLLEETFGIYPSRCRCATGE